MLKYCETLDECERKLAEELRAVDLVGQVALTDDDLEKVSHLIARWITGNELSVYAPPSCSLASFLVWVGIRKYEAGRYWPAVGDALGVPVDGGLYAELSEGFLRFLSDRRLPTFEEVGGLRYVTPILAHGGIPDYCLADFFAGVLLPIITGKLEVDAGDPTAIVEEYRQRPGMFAFADMPVSRFLLHGSRAAADFLGRCVEMALRTAADGVTPTADELGLPERIIQRYEDWWRGVRADSAATGRLSVWRRPALGFTPEYGEIALHLPRQRLAPGPRQLKVSVGANDMHPVVVPLQTRRRGQFLETDDEQVPLESPAERYAATVLDEAGNELQTWALQGTRQQGAFAVFAEHGPAILAGELPRERVWMITPEQTEVGGGVRIVEEGAPLYGGWANHRAMLLDLSGTDSVILRRDGNETRVPVEPEGPAEPHLSSVREVARVTSDGASVYARPPYLVLPLPEDAPRWQLSITRLGDTSQGVRINTRLSDAPLAAAPDGTRGVDLAAASLLGPDAVGQFRLRVRGPLGRDRYYRFAVLPGLAVTFDHLAYWPAQDTLEAPQVAFNLEGRGLRSLEAQQPCSSEHQDRGWRVAVPASEGRVELEGEFDCGEKHIRAPLTVSVPRLRIGLRGVHPMGLEWSFSTLQVTTDDESDLRGMAVLLDLPVDAGQVKLWVDDGRQVTRRQLQRGRARVELSAFADTLRDSRHSSVLFRLDLTSGPSSKRGVPVLVARTRWAVGDLEVSEEVRRERRRLEIRWKQQGHTRPADRVLRVWSIWRPWERPYEVAIADDEEAVALELPVAAFRPGLYHFELSVRDPWVQALPQRAPDVDGAAVFEVSIGDRQERRAFLESLQGNLRDLLERLVAVRESSAQEVEHLVEQLAFPRTASADDAAALVLVLLSWLPDVDYRGGLVRRLWERVCAACGEAAIEALAGQSISRLRTSGDRGRRLDCDRLCVLLGMEEPELPYVVGDVVEHTEPGLGGCRRLRYVGRQDGQHGKRLLFVSLQDGGTVSIPLARYHLLRRVDPADAEAKVRRRKGRRRP